MGEQNQIPGTELFSRSGMSRYESIEVTMTDKDGNKVTKTVLRYNEENKEDKASLYTLSQIQINEDVIKNVNLLPLNSTTSLGEYDATVVQKINDMWGKEFATLDPNTLTKHTFKEYYTALVGEVGSVGNTYGIIAENQQTMVSGIDNSRMQVTGVSSEEELSNLIKYQHAYNASSRYINTVSQMLDSLMNAFFS